MSIVGYSHRAERVYHSLNEAGKRGKARGVALGTDDRRQLIQSTPHDRFAV
jgi:hypothetical protein